MRTSLMCRTCLASIGGKDYHALSKTFPSKKYPSLEDRCKLCVPEIDFSIIKESVLCDLCYRKIVTLFNFKIRCLSNETRIQQMLTQAPSQDADYVIKEIKLDSETEEDAEANGENEPFVMEDPDTDILNSVVNISQSDIIFMDNTDIENIETVVTDIVATDNTMDTPAIEDCQFYECDKCSYSTEYDRNFQKHLKVHRLNAVAAAGKINKRRIYPYALYIQSDSKTKELCCRICQRSYPRRSLIVKHIRGHLDKQKYRCLFCDSRCSSRGNLRIHMKIHTDTKRLQCRYCSYTTIYKTVLESHDRLHMSDKQYQCDECQFTFISMHALKSHKLKHRVQRPYQCDQCPKSYVYMTSLAFHKKGHAGMKPHICENCRKGFRERYELSRHMKIGKCSGIYNDVRKCLYCNKTVLGLKALLEHMKVHPEYNSNSINVELEGDFK